MLELRNVFINIAVLACGLVMFLSGTLMAFSPRRWLRVQNWWQRRGSSNVMFSEQQLDGKGSNLHRQLGGVVISAVSLIFIFGPVQKLAGLFQTALPEVTQSAPMVIGVDSKWLKLGVCAILLFLGGNLIKRPIRTFTAIFRYGGFSQGFLNDSRLPTQLKILGTAMVVVGLLAIGIIVANTP